MKKRARAKTMQSRIYPRFIAAFLPLILLVVSLNLYTDHLIQKHYTSLTANSLSLLNSQLHLTLTHMDRSILNAELDQLYYERVGQADHPSDALVSATLRIPMRSLLAIYTFCDGVFFYPEGGTGVTTASIEYRDLQKKQSILQYLNGIVGNAEVPHVSQWMTAELGGDYYLVRILYVSGARVGVWMRPRNLIAYLVRSELNSIESFGFINAENVPLFGEYPGFSERYARKMRENDESTTMSFYENGDLYNVVLMKFDALPLTAAAFIQTPRILERLPLLHLVLVAFSLLTLLLVLLALHRILQTILQPTREIVAAMQNLGKGDFSIRFQRKNTYVEYQIIGDAFNNMADEIHQLKIQAYEERLRMERTELRFLQLQLTPHFFINTLNVVYSLAQIHDYASIERMVLSLTDYFRYSMKASSQMAMLRDEIRHVHNYLAIQKMRYSDRFFLRVDCPPELEECSVPLFVLQTFVENSMKYAFLGDNQVMIHIAIRGDAARRSLLIDIFDNGPGFPEEILSGNWDQLTSKGHIGLDNMQSRLKLLFAGRARMELSNRGEGGSHVHIRIPYAIAPGSALAVSGEGLKKNTIPQ